MEDLTPSAQARKVRAVFLERIGGDETLVKMCLELFPEEISQKIEELKTTIRENNAEAIKHHAHTIKGMAANISAGRLRDAAYEVETAAKQGDAETAKQLVEKLEQEAQRLGVLSDKTYLRVNRIFN